jgi:hypothetical protein
MDQTGLHHKVLFLLDQATGTAPIRLVPQLAHPETIPNPPEGLIQQVHPPNPTELPPLCPPTAVLTPTSPCSPRRPALGEEAALVEVALLETVHTMLLHKPANLHHLTTLTAAVSTTLVVMSPAHPPVLAATTHLNVNATPIPPAHPQSPPGAATNT